MADKATSTLHAVTVRLDDREPVRGELMVSREVETIYSERATKPDSAWEYTDPFGHWHAYADDGSLPTLDAKQEHVDCDGTCGGLCEGEGYKVTRYYCRICSAPVEPARVPDHEPRNIFTGWSWTVVVYTFIPPGEEMSVQVVAEDRTAFGVGVSSGSTVRSRHGETDTRTTINGVGPLGWRARS
jgi:hypothetical protein